MFCPAFSLLPAAAFENLAGFDAVRELGQALPDTMEPVVAAVQVRFCGSLGFGRCHVPLHCSLLFLQSVCSVYAKLVTASALLQGEVHLFKSCISV